MATAYASTLKVFEFLRWNNRVPTFVSGETPVLETVDNSGTLTAADVLYLDQNKVIDNTLILTHGPSVTASTAVLAKTTDYTIDLDRAKITLTGKGATAISANEVHAEYQHNDMIDDSVISDMIDRAGEWMGKEIYKTYGTSIVVLSEEQPGRGAYDRLYRPLNLPVQIAKTQVAGTAVLGGGFVSAGTATTAMIAITVSTAVQVVSTEGFNVSDVITINDEQMRVLTVSAASLAVERGFKGTATDHSVDDWVINMGFEISNTPLGSVPNWNLLSYRSNFDADSDTGAVQLMHINAGDRDDLSRTIYPLPKIFNRVRVSYRYGDTEIPEPLEKAVIMLVARDLMNSALSKSLPEGIDGFSPTAIEQIDKQIEMLIRKYRTLISRGF